MHWCHKSSSVLNAVNGCRFSRASLFDKCYIGRHSTDTRKTLLTTKHPPQKTPKRTFNAASLELQSWALLDPAEGHPLACYAWCCCLPLSSQRD
jgi:hypothetical protein